MAKRNPPCGNYGDINGDGYVTQADADLVAEHVAGIIVLTSRQLERADVRGDGDITVINAALIAKYAAYVEGYDTFPVCAKVPPAIDCARCDFNGDGYVNFDDVVVIKAAYGSRPGDSNWNPDADLNGDGVVDYKDMGILTKCWGPVGAPPPGGVTPPAYLTPDDALLRIRAGEKCYIKCTLPILNMLPGIPYMSGIPILPGFAITTEP